MQICGCDLMLKINLAKFKQNIPIPIFENVFKNNLNVSSEQVLIVGDKGYGPSNLISPILTNAFSVAANNLGISNNVIYQTTKVRGDVADELFLRALKNLPPKSIVIMNLSNRIGDMNYLGKSFRTFCKLRGHRFLSAGSWGSLTNDYLKPIINTLDVDINSLEKEALKLKKKLDDASRVNILTKKGTDLEIGIEKMQAKVATGKYKEPGTGGNLIPAETYIPPAPLKVDGRVVIDGSIRTNNRTMICKNPVILDIQKGIINSMNESTEARQLKNTLDWAIKRSKLPLNCKKICELGIGLNPKAKIIGATIVDEKTLGTAHVAIGSNSWFGGDIQSIIHLDQVFKNPIFKIDGRLLHLKNN